MMKKLFLFFILAVFATNMFAQSDKFSGVIDFQITDDLVGTQKITQHTNGTDTKVLVEASDAGEILIKDGQMYIIIHQMKVYMPANKIEGEEEETVVEDESVDVDLDKLKAELDKAETKEINGYTCKKFVTKNDDGTSTEAWLTDELNAGLFMDDEQQDMEWLSGLYGESIFPMLVHEKDAEGNITFTLEVTKVEEKTFEDGYFDLPSGYTSFEQSEMMKGMENMFK